MHPWLEEWEVKANRATIEGHMQYLTFVAKELALWAEFAANPEVDWKQLQHTQAARAQPPVPQSPLIGSSILFNKRRGMDILPTQAGNQKADEGHSFR